MENLRLFKLLKTFSPQEMKDFEKFVVSPYFSKGRNLKPLFSIVKKYYPEFKSPYFTQENVFKKLFPGKKYEGKKSAHALSVVTSELTLLAEKFLAIDYLQKADEGYGIYDALSCSLRYRKMDNERHKIILKNIERIPKRDTAVYDISDHFPELIKQYGESGGIYDNEKKFLKGLEIVRKMQLYTYGYYIEMYSYILNAYDFYKIKNLTLPENKVFFERGLLNFEPVEFEKEFYDDGLGTKQHILINYYIIKSQLEADDKGSLIKAVEYYISNLDKISLSNKIEIFDWLTNICDRRYIIPGKEKEYALIGSDLVDSVFLKYVQDNPSGDINIGPASINQFFGFKNTVLDLKELNSFVDTLIKIVPAEHKKYTYNYCYAWINFKEGNFGKTLELVSKTNIKSVRTISRMNQLKILSLFSLGYIEEAVYSTNSYERFIIRNKLPQYVSDLKFIEAFRLLIKLTASSTDINTLEKTVNEFVNYNLKPWFKEQIEKLNKPK